MSRGTRTAVPALSLPQDLPDRELLQGITFGVVLFTLFVQGSTADLVVRRLVPSRQPGPSTAPEQTPPGS